MSTQKEARQRYGDVHESEALRVPEEKAEQLVDALNTDLAATYVLYHQVKSTTGSSRAPSSATSTSTTARSRRT